MSDFDTDYVPSARKLRHSIRVRIGKAYVLTGGQPGLDKDQQIYVVKTQIQLLEEALVKAKALLDVVENRDFDTYKAIKDAKAQMPDVEKLPASEQAAMENLTFEQLVAKLGDTPGEPDDQPEDTPPF